MLTSCSQTNPVTASPTSGAPTIDTASTLIPVSQTTPGESEPAPEEITLSTLSTLIVVSHTSALGLNLTSENSSVANGSNSMPGFQPLSVNPASASEINSVSEFSGSSVLTLITQTTPIDSGFIIGVSMSYSTASASTVSTTTSSLGSIWGATSVDASSAVLSAYATIPKTPGNGVPSIAA